MIGQRGLGCAPGAPGWRGGRSRRGSASPSPRTGAASPAGRPPRCRCRSRAATAPPPPPSTPSSSPSSYLAETPFSLSLSLARSSRSLEKKQGRKAVEARGCFWKRAARATAMTCGLRVGTTGPTSVCLFLSILKWALQGPQQASFRPSTGSNVGPL